MGFTVNLLPSEDRFKAICTQLTHLGEVGFERVCISKVEEGFLPTLTSKPGWIERILRFFRFKSKNTRLQEVANFSLNWLRAHAFHYTKEFHQQIVQLENLRPLMKKARLEKEFDVLIADTKEKASLDNRLQRFVEDSKKMIADRMQQLDELAKQQQDEYRQAIGKVQERTSHFEGVTSQLIARKGRIPILADFNLYWPQSFKEKDKTEPLIKAIISDFLLKPGATIRRQKKSTKINLDVPEEETRIYDLPVKIDFYLEGAVRQRQVIMKTNEVIGKGGQRKVLQAYDLLSGRQLVSKPFVSDMERLLVRSFYQKRIAGVVPYFAGTDKRFYEMKCEPLSHFLTQPITVRKKMALDLISALNSIHDCFFADCDAPCSDGVRVSIPRLPHYHGDIKFPNILVCENASGNPEAVLADFGGAVAVSKFQYSLFFRSPELTRFIENKVYFFGKPSSFLRERQIIEHNVNFGQSNDVWSLGLALLSLLSGKTLKGFEPAIEEVGVPDLRCFGNHLQKSRFRPARTPDGWIQDLTQIEMDESIAELEIKCSLPDEAKKIWSCIQKMLQVDPKNRATMKQVCSDLDL